jgi:type II secretory pathway component PulJ
MKRMTKARTLRGQTKLEAMIALALLIIAGAGAWMLYGDQIIATTKAMVQSIFGQ